MSSAFWKGRSVLVTGHTGFKGSWLCLWLKLLGARVHGLALEPATSPSLFDLAGLAREIPGVIGDVRDPETVNRAFRESAPEVVLHLAAQSIVRESYRRPADTFATNVLGTVNCLEALRQSATARAMVVVTTDKCYRNVGAPKAYRETDELGGDDPYSASKASAELVAHAYRRSFFDAHGSALVATARAGNVVGGGDWAAERLVPDAMRAFGTSQALAIRNPGFTRPWQHVLEPLRGYLVLAERLLEGKREAATAWNFGPDPADVRPVGWIAEELAKRWGDGVRWIAQNQREVHEASELALDSGKARAELSWRPALSLERTLDWVVEWYKGLARGGNARALTVDQVGRYQALCPR